MAILTGIIPQTITDFFYRFVRHAHDGTEYAGGDLGAISISGNLTMAAGKGIILKSPDGLITQLVSLGNDGQLHYDDQ